MGAEEKKFIEGALESCFCECEESGEIFSGRFWSSLGVKGPGTNEEHTRVHTKCNRDPLDMGWRETGAEEQVLVKERFSLVFRAVRASRLTEVKLTDIGGTRENAFVS